MKRSLHAELEAALAREGMAVELYSQIKKENEELQLLCQRLKLEAQIHAQEARAQQAIVRECLQVCTDATGEPGDWEAVSAIRNAINNARQKKDNNAQA